MLDDFRMELSHDESASIAEWIFLRTVEDLKGRINEPLKRSSRYEMLGIAPLLRKLLIDGGNLLNRANRRHRRAFEFNIVPFKKSDQECLTMLRIAGVHPDIPYDKLTFWRVFEPSDLIPRDGNPGELLDLKRFLRAHVGITTRKLVSVKELIQFYCIVEGAVHIGEGRNPIEKELLTTVLLELRMPEQGIATSPIGTLLPLAEIVIDSVRPLVEAIQSDPAPLTQQRGLSGMAWGPTYSGWGRK